MANKTQTARKSRFAFDRNSPLGQFWGWWSGELRELAPQWMLQSGTSANTLLIEIGAHAVVLRRWVQGSLAEVGRLDLQAADSTGINIAFQTLVTRLRKRNDRIALWLAGSQFLSKQIELPLATAENLRQVLGFEMDRHTPFKADQVYFDFRVVQRDTQNSRLVAELVLAPRASVDAALEQLARWGIPAHAVYVASGSPPSDDPMDLMPADRRVTKTSAQHMFNLGLLAFVVVLAISAITIPLWQKRQVAIALIPMVALAKSQATSTDALRRDWDKRSADYNFVLEKKQTVPPLVVQLDELTRLLPDDTWVQQLDLKGKELQIQGETASSSKLIALVESSRILREANFRSPLTKGLAPNSERYHLVAEVKPLTVEAIAAMRPPPAPAVIAPVPGAALPGAAQAPAAVAVTVPVPGAALPSPAASRTPAATAPGAALKPVPTVPAALPPLQPITPPALPTPVPKAADKAKGAVQPNAGGKP
ncbi:hypothetical protein BH11PSE11_BH11PSE11_13040 [soil metagenome]